MTLHNNINPAHGENGNTIFSTNPLLDRQINKVENEAEKNYYKRAIEAESKEYGNQKNE